MERSVADTRLPAQAPHALDLLFSESEEDNRLGMTLLYSMLFRCLDAGYGEGAGANAALAVIRLLAAPGNSSGGDSGSSSGGGSSSSSERSSSSNTGANIDDFTQHDKVLVHIWAKLPLVGRALLHDILLHGKDPSNAAVQTALRCLMLLQYYYKDLMCQAFALSHGIESLLWHMCIHWPPVPRAGSRPSGEYIWQEHGSSGSSSSSAGSRSIGRSGERGGGTKGCSSGDDKGGSSAAAGGHVEGGGDNSRRGGVDDGGGGRRDIGDALPAVQAVQAVQERIDDELPEGLVVAMGLVSCMCKAYPQLGPLNVGLPEEHEGALWWFDTFIETAQRWDEQESRRMGFPVHACSAMCCKLLASELLHAHASIPAALYDERGDHEDCCTPITEEDVVDYGRGPMLDAAKFGSLHRALYAGNLISTAMPLVRSSCTALKAASAATDAQSTRPSATDMQTVRGGSGVGVGSTAGEPSTAAAAGRLPDEIPHTSSSSSELQQLRQALLQVVLALLRVAMQNVQPLSAWPGHVGPAPVMLWKFVNTCLAELHTKDLSCLLPSLKGLTAADAGKAEDDDGHRVDRQYSLHQRCNQYMALVYLSFNASIRAEVRDLMVSELPGLVAEVQHMAAVAMTRGQEASSVDGAPAEPSSTGRHGDSSSGGSAYVSEKETVGDFATNVLHLIAAERALPGFFGAFSQSCLAALLKHGLLQALTACAQAARSRPDMPSLGYVLLDACQLVAERCPAFSGAVAAAHVACGRQQAAGSMPPAAGAAPSSGAGVDADAAAVSSSIAPAAAAAAALAAAGGAAVAAADDDDDISNTSSNSNNSNIRPGSRNVRAKGYRPMGNAASLYDWLVVMMLEVEAMDVLTQAASQQQEQQQQRHEQHVLHGKPAASASASATSGATPATAASGTTTGSTSRTVEVPIDNEESTGDVLLPLLDLLPFKGPHKPLQVVLARLEPFMERLRQRVQALEAVAKPAGLHAARSDSTASRGSTAASAGAASAPAGTEGAVLQAPPAATAAKKRLYTFSSCPGVLCMSDDSDTEPEYLAGPSNASATAATAAAAAACVTDAVLKPSSSSSSSTTSASTRPPSITVEEQYRVLPIGSTGTTGRTPTTTVTSTTASPITPAISAPASGPAIAIPAAPQPPPIASPPPPPASGSTLRRACVQCGAVPSSGNIRLHRCGGCERVRYCGVECQRAHWKAGHKAECSGRRVGGSG